MKTAQPMLTRAARTLRTLGASLAASASLLTGACTPSKAPAPQALASPYIADRALVFAVAPLRNESGTTTADELALSDTLVNELAQTPGISVLPVNRTLAAMRALNLAAISTPAQAAALARTLKADAIVVGAISAWDPYDPPVIGLSLALFPVSPEMQRLTTLPAPQSSDPLALRGSATDPAGSAPRTPGATSVVSAVLDASNGAVRQRIRDYAQGRHDPKSALKWKQYTASMALYAKFACFDMSQRLLRAEQDRLAQAEAIEQQ